eukprot:3602642-Pyramimonas_sp.AAC.1
MAFPDHASTGADESKCQRAHLASSGCRSNDIPGTPLSGSDVCSINPARSHESAHRLAFVPSAACNRQVFVHEPPDWGGAQPENITNWQHSWPRHPSDSGSSVPALLPLKLSLGKQGKPHELNNRGRIRPPSPSPAPPPPNENDWTYGNGRAGQGRGGGGGHDVQVHATSPAVLRVS